jgi:hypothetical protein
MIHIYYTWKCPVNNVRYPIDHVLVSASVHSWMVDCGVECGIELHSDHYPVQLCLSLPSAVASLVGCARKVLKKKRLKKIKRNFKSFANDPDMQLLVGNRIDEELTSVRNSFIDDVSNGDHLNELANLVALSMQKGCETIPRVVKSNRHNADWFDKNNVAVQRLVLDRMESRRKYLSNRNEFNKAAYRKCQSLVQAECRRMRNRFWSDIAHDLECLLDCNDVSCFYEGLKIVYGKKPVAMVSGLQGSGNQLLKSDGTTLTTSEEEIVDRWIEHFNKLLNQPGSVSSSIDSYLPEAMDICVKLDDEFSEVEVGDAFFEMKCGTAAGLDGVPPEIEKYAKSDHLIPVITRLFNRSLATGVVPQQWKDVIITILFKSGDKRSCDNYRGISLINIIGKALERVILNRVIGYCESKATIFPDSQYGFRKNRGTMDNMFISREIAYSARDKGVNLFKCYVDLTKAYDKVNRDLLWKILKLRGFPPNIINLIKGLLVGSMAHLRLDGILHDPFELLRGLKQGSVFSPILFNIFFGAIIEIFRLRVVHLGVSLDVKLGGNPFIVQSQQCKSRIDKIKVDDLDFADDTALFATSAEDLQKMMDVFVEVSDAYGQEVSIKKTKVLVVVGKKSLNSLMDVRDDTTGGVSTLPAAAVATKRAKPGILKCRKKQNLEGVDGEWKTFKFQVKGQDIEVVETFKYVGSTENQFANTIDEVAVRKNRMLAAFAKLRGRCFCNNALDMKIRLRVFDVIVMGNGLYGCGSWNMTQGDVESLESCQFHLLRQLMNIKWKDRVSNLDVLLKARQCGYSLRPLSCMVANYRLRYLYHIMSLDDSALVKKLFFGEISSGKRLSGKREMSFKACLQKDLALFDITDDWSNSSLIAKNECWLRCAAKLGSKASWFSWLDGEGMLTAVKKWINYRDEESNLRRLHAAILNDSVCTSRGTRSSNCSIDLFDEYVVAV